jgi:hypothetical protein
MWMLIGLAAVIPFASTAGAQGSPAPNADFSNAALAEAKNAQGQVVLSGKFALAEEEDDDVERKAKLTPGGAATDASGEADVEISGTGNERRQEIEFTMKNLQPSAVFTLVIDGKVVATVTADDKGRATYEREVPLPAATTSPPE